MKDPLATRLYRALETAAGTLDERDLGAFELADALGFGGFLRRHGDPLHASSGSSAESLMRRLVERILVDTAAELSTVLEGLMVPHFFAKGIALVDWVYRPGDREMADIDLYVHPQAATIAVNAMREMGYRDLPSDEQSGPSSLRPGVALCRADGGSDLEAVTVDVHWGVEPVDRLLPRADTNLPETIWGSIQTPAAVPIPDAEHHAALLVYHLAHHDLLHVRGLVDLALVWPKITDARTLRTLAVALDVERALQALAQVLVRDLGLPAHAAVGALPDDWRGRRLRRRLVLPRWIAWVWGSDARELVEVTPRRIGMRLLLLDALQSALPLLSDVVFPPHAHLRWRWPEAESEWEAWRLHAASVTRKLLQRG